MKITTKAFPAFTLLSVPIIFFFIHSGCSSNTGTKETAKDSVSMVTEMAMSDNKSHELQIAMNKLWEDHVTWTRNVILCLVDGLPGTDQAVNRLMQNQVDIGNAIKPYYGDDAGTKLTGLLKVHITIAAEVVTAAKTGDKMALDSANVKWYANADEISAFLSSANPNWPLADMQLMMNDHLKLTTDEAVQRIKKDYDADIKAYDKVHDEILLMSAMLADGIIKQFPDKFKPASN
jgi:hypothetical protein